MAITFEFISSYMGDADYEVSGDGPVYRVSIRDSVSEYMRSICNVKGGEFEREYTNSIGILRRSGGHTSGYRGIHGLVKPEVLNSFNNWKLARREAAVEQISTNWRTYFQTRPTRAVAGYYSLEDGWVKGWPDLEFEACRQRVTWEAWKAHIRVFTSGSTLAESRSRAVDAWRQAEESWSLLRGIKMENTGRYEVVAYLS